MVAGNAQKPRKRMTTGEALVAPILFVAFVCWYAMCEDGTASSNDGSSYALTKSIAERGSLSIGEREEMNRFQDEGVPIFYTDNTPENAERYWMLTEAIDVAVRDGKLYTDRSPGTSFLAVPFYYMGEAAARLFPPEKAQLLYTTPQIERWRDAWNDAYWSILVDAYEKGKNQRNISLSQNPEGFEKQMAKFYRLGWDGRPLPPAPTVSTAERTRQYFATLLSGVATALAAAFIYLSCRLMGVKTPAAVGAALVYGLCTMYIKYATVLFTHSVAGFFVVLSLYLTLRIGHADRKTAPNYAALGLAMALAFVCEYPTILFCAGFLAYLFVIDLRQRVPLVKALPLYAMITAGALIPLAAFGAYNYYCFGKVFTTSYGYQAGFDFNKDIFQAFREPMGRGLYLLLISPETNGVLVISPVLLLAMGGFCFFFKAHRAEAVTVGALFLLMLLIMSKKTETVAGMRDPRYLATDMGLLVMGAGFFLDGVLRARRADLRYIGLALFAGLFIYSAVKQFSCYLMFIPGRESEQRITDFGLTFPGYPKLLIVFPLAAAAGAAWFFVRRRLCPPGTIEASPVGKKTSRKALSGGRPSEYNGSLKRNPRYPK